MDAVQASEEKGCRCPEVHRVSPPQAHDSVNRGQPAELTGLLPSHERKRSINYKEDPTKRCWSVWHHESIFRMNKTEQPELQPSVPVLFCDTDKKTKVDWESNSNNWIYRVRLHQTSAGVTTTKPFQFRLKLVTHKQQRLKHCNTDFGFTVLKY